MGDPCIDKLSVETVVTPERGCVEDQPQHVRPAHVLRLVLCTQPRSYRQLPEALASEARND